MFGYIVRRLVAGVLVLIAVSMMVFAIFFYGPNDPALAYCPESRCTPERLENISHNLGLDRPAPQQYVEYMSGLVKSRHIESGGISIDCDWPCLGVSFKYRVSVFDYLWDRFPATLSVAVGGAICFLALGLSSGIFAARRRGTASDKAIVSTSLFINAIPYYLLALLAYLYLVQAWGIFPETGYFSPFEYGPAKFVAGMLLPWIMIGIAYSTQYARFSRGAMIDSLNEDYVRTARAKGLSPGVVDRRHVLRNALLPVTTVIGLQTGLLLSGAILTETVFAFPGMGSWLRDAIFNRDYPVLQGGILFLALVFVLINLAVDIVYAFLNPRIRYA
jgi:peptide/nickel transport system permease protein